MPATQTNLTIEQGTTYTHGWAVTVDGEPIDDTWTARGQVRARITSADTLYEFDVDVDADGNVVLAVDADTSTAWEWRRGHYDIEVVNADESVILRVAEGRVRVNPEVTR